MAESTPARRRPRADAFRNRQRLLSAADAIFADVGAAAPLERVARQARVGIGTLYGHFPTRRALIAELLAQRNAALFDHGERLGERPAADAVTEWATAVVEHAATYRGLAAVLADGFGDDASELHEDCLRMNRIGEGLLSRAQQAGAVRSDVTADDLFALINAVAWTREHAGPQSAGRLLELALSGMLTAPPRRGGTLPG
jgi:AcrR family transcriptional regulator